MSEGPKLTHLTASRPKVKGRRPPKRYDVFHEDDSKEVREGGREEGAGGRGGRGGSQLSTSKSMHNMPYILQTTFKFLIGGAAEWHCFENDATSQISA